MEDTVIVAATRTAVGMHRCRPPALQHSSTAAACSLQPAASSLKQTIRLTSEVHFRFPPPCIVPIHCSRFHRNAT